MRKLHGLVLSAVLAFFLSPSGFAAPAAPKELRVQLTSEPMSLDPAIAEDGVSIKVLANVIEGLMGYDGAGKLRNNLAEKYEISKDRKRYTFTLKPGAKWSDGKTVTAEEFVLGVRRSVDPKMASPLANMLFCIRNAKTIYAGKATLESLGVRAEGPSKVVFELEKPTSYFLHVLTLSQTAPVRADVLKANGDKWPDIAPSTGPYRIVSHRRDQDLRLEPNPFYWNPKSARLPVLFRVVADESTGVTLFESGDLDIIAKIPPLDIARLKARGVVKQDPQLVTYFLSFNTKKPPFDDRDFRRAVSGAINRPEIVSLLGTSDQPALSWAPPNVEGFVPYRDPAPIFKDSVESVREKLKKKPVSGVVASFNASQLNSTVMERIQQDLKARLGLDVELLQQDWKTHTKSLRTGPAHIYRYGRGDPFMDAIWHFASYRSDDPNNGTGWKSAEYDRLVDEIASAPSVAARTTKLARAQKLLVEEEAIVVPVFHQVQVHAVSPRVRGFRVNPVTAILFEELTLQER